MMGLASGNNPLTFLSASAHNTNIRSSSNVGPGGVFLNTPCPATPSSSSSALILTSTKCNSYPCKPNTLNTARRIRCSLIQVEDENNEACELVSGMELSLGAEDDRIHAYLLKAVKNNNGTGVLLLSDIFGFEDSSTRDFAYRVACNGYNVLVPDLFRGDPWSKDRPKEMFEQWMAKQNRETIQKDIEMSKRWMMDEFSAVGISKKLGIVGFCFGGGRVLEVLARDDGDQFGAAVSFYGTRMDKSISSKINVPVLFISGDNDPLCPVSLQQEIQMSIGRGSDVVIFEGRGHGFAHRPESPEEDNDAEQAFLLMKNWLYDALVVNK